MEPGTILRGDCREQLATLPAESVAAIVTDPPYELGFMGKRWDATGIAYDPVVWSECLRVLKPGGHLLAFGGTRTYHRMTVAIEDAGFEIRDSLHWLYGTGFPKSLDVAKGIDKRRHDRADVYRITAWIRETRDANGITNKEIDDAFGFVGMAGHWTSSASQPAVPSLEQVPTLLAALRLTLDDVPDEIRTLLWDLNGRKGQPGPEWWKREVTGTHDKAAAAQSWKAQHGFHADLTPRERRDVPASETSAAWQGWGTALKPAHEPIVLARKPTTGTVVANVLEHGTGALNIDANRIGRTTGDVSHAGNRTATFGTQDTVSGGDGSGGWTENPTGRWPANLVLTHAPTCDLDADCGPGCPVAELDAQSVDGPASATPNAGGASRFFATSEWNPEMDAPFLYVAKPSRRERDAGLEDSNTHPTVKPVALMRHLVRLVTPPGGIVLDPFLGSGTTAVAATLEGFEWIGCELTTEYVPIIEARVAWAAEHREPFEQLTLNT
jgi:DNA modification methylase